MYKHMASCAFFLLVFRAQWCWDQDLYRKLDCAGVLGLSTVAEPCSSHTPHCFSLFIPKIGSQSLRPQMNAREGVTDGGAWTRMSEVPDWMILLPALV